MDIWQKELKKVGKCPQRQDSTEDQLRDLIVIAHKFGFYDAADFIKNRITLQPQTHFLDIDD